MKIKLILPVIILASFTVLAGNCRNTPAGVQNADFQIRITQMWAGHPVNSWQIDKEKVIHKVDLASSKDGREAYRGTLSEDEKNAIASFMSMVDFDALQENYSGGPVTDGLQFYLEIRYGDKMKKLFVANFFNRDVAKIINSANRLFPQGHTFIYK